MKNKSFFSIILGLVAAGGISLAQAPPESVELVTGKNHYQHGHNAAFPSTGNKDTPREDKDSVMIASTMHYFVLPAEDFNSAYYSGAAAAQPPWTNTNETKSQFVWKLKNSFGTPAAVNQNSTGTSPHVTVQWSAIGEVELKLVEEPKEYKGITLSSVVCPSDTVRIPVIVIHQPSVKFGQVNSTYTDSKCVDDPNTNIKLPLIPATVTGNFGANISDADEVTISYTISKNGATATPATATFPNLRVASKDWEIPVTDWGKYEVTITAITDRIAQKCNITTTSDAHIGTSAERTFTYLVVPKPVPGPRYHIPNRY
ncbi:MAG: hypothetical protein LBE71_05980 [Dysgonamonadaceae bacterium]|jgi:hypothetical protein|nr:hypothetical protein [Dysgonamonadaceae bacterium]